MTFPCQVSDPAGLWQFLRPSMPTNRVPLRVGGGGGVLRAVTDGDFAHQVWTFPVPFAAKA